MAAITENPACRDHSGDEECAPSMLNHFNLTWTLDKAKELPTGRTIISDTYASQFGLEWFAARRAPAPKRVVHCAEMQ